jgi:UDP-galactopyranose mutase
MRWDFVFQRPQHLMTRFANRYRIFFIEEPLFHQEEDCYRVKLTEENIWVITPYLDERIKEENHFVSRQKSLVSSLFLQFDIHRFIGWYYTPMALKISSHLKPDMIIYDCMDELSAFKFAPVELKIMETELLKKANLVFTGGQSLYEAKKHLHHNIHPFPSSIDKAHFAKARDQRNEPDDQRDIAGIKIGFYGVIDERFNISLIREVAEKKPEWQLILIGPVLKIDPADLPVAPNIHYLGGKSYSVLPEYLSGWNIAMIPFEKNESTRFISPTKTPEYLAAARPVVSASIEDVVNPYGERGLVHIADSSDEFIKAVNKELARSADEFAHWLKRVDGFMKELSWDNTTAKMEERINECLTQLEADKIQNKTGLRSVA